MASFTNQAHLSYNGRSVASNVVTGQMLSPLTLTKTAVVDTYAPTDTVTYVITIVNSGATAYTDLTLTDDLGAYAAGGQTVYPLSYTPDSAVWFINGTRQADPTASGAPLVISGLSVPAGGNAVILYEAATTDAAPLAEGSEITNAVTLTGSGIGTPLTAQATVTVEAQANLRITKSLSPAVVAENGSLTYTFLIQNEGNLPAGPDAAVVVTDTFDPILRDLTVTLNDLPLAVTTGYTYDESTGAFATVAGQITVPAATFSQSTETGDWETVPGEAVLTVTGTVG
ncbi:MAG: hypothetical protein IIZ96_00080 [Oscillospiraceae bacterium]|nr:hypothetical protein [Oscillospiraceae bacterium]MBQ9374061.1 hypothetical protein [Oscillospiraceae bacterium]